MEYHVLKNGRPEGPFTDAELIQHLEAGRFLPQDLAQRDGTRHWTPLRRIFALETDASAPDVRAKLLRFRHAFLRVAAQVRGIFAQHPLETGVLCLAAGCVVVVLSYVPLLMFGPWLLGAMAAGGILMTRGQVLSGLLLAAAAVFIPIILWLLMAHLTGSFWTR